MSDWQTRNLLNSVQSRFQFRARVMWLLLQRESMRQIAKHCLSSALKGAIYIRSMFQALRCVCELQIGIVQTDHRSACHLMYRQVQLCRKWNVAIYFAPHSGVLPHNLNLTLTAIWSVHCSTCPIGWYACDRSISRIYPADSLLLGTIWMFIQTILMVVIMW